MKVQIALTVNESKRIIAKAVVSLPEIKNALEEGKILLKGGTTVSAIAEELVGIPLRICGRISKRGTVSSQIISVKHPHSILLEKGKIKNIDDNIVEVVKNLGRGDIIIISGNALDSQKNVGMMAGSVSGGNPGIAVSGMLSEGAEVIIPIGLEKLILGTIRDASIIAGRKDVDVSYGMAVGLIPLYGKVVTEKDAVEILAKLNCTVIGKGGILGAEGSTVMVVEGLDKEVKKILKVIKEVKGADISGQKESLEECKRGNLSCKNHLACIYLGGV
ncbi:hypothetical protein KJ813_01705 [bacterium]|nr:hypothetical protein [bacterium]MBU4361363.1 hypothetical protein [bacterium]MBU4603109.1 hypothetical protein [bacterium]